MSLCQRVERIMWSSSARCEEMISLKPAQVVAAVGTCGVQISSPVGWDHTSFQRQLELAVLGAWGCIRMEYWLCELGIGHQPVRMEPAEKYLPVSLSCWKSSLELSMCSLNTCICKLP